MICMKFDQKNKKNLKNLNFGHLRFFSFFIGFFRSHFPAWSVRLSVHGLTDGQTRRHNAQR